MFKRVIISEISVRAIVTAGKVTSPILATALTLSVPFTPFFSFASRVIRVVVVPVGGSVLRRLVPVVGPSVPIRGATPPAFRFAFSFATLILFDLSFRGLGFTFPF